MTIMHSLRLYMFFSSEKTGRTVAFTQYFYILLIKEFFIIDFIHKKSQRMSMKNNNFFKFPGNMYNNQLTHGYCPTYLQNLLHIRQNI